MQRLLLRRLERLGRAEEGFPRGFMRLAHGIPSRDAFSNLFNTPDPGACSGRCCGLPRVGWPGWAVGWVAIDGKALRRSFAAAASRSPPHPVRAFVGGARPVLGQVRVEDKSNGIAAVPTLLEMSAPKGRTVTADAMRTRRWTARAVTAAGGDDHVPTLKGNRARRTKT